MLLVGANAIQDGITIDLRKMNQTVLSTDKQTVAVGPGAKWGEVYQYLDSRGAAIPGGRASDVGVAGLTLGGGNSFYASRYGFVCDSVKNFEIVLGNGTITNANAQQNPDLFKGLKGSSGNLGLVTRFDFVAFPSGPLWGGRTAYSYADLPKFFAPIIDFTNNLANDPYGSLIAFWGHNATSNQTIVSTLYDYTGNATELPYYNASTTSTNTTAAPAPFPSTFSNFTFDKVGTPLTNNLGVASLYNITSQLNLPPGQRSIYASLHFKATLEVLTAVNKIIEDTLTPTYSDPHYVFALAEYQPLPRVFTDHSIQRGGNVLGLDAVKDNGIMLMLALLWEDEAEDDANRALMSAIMSNVTTHTQKVDAYRPWLYVNYAYEDEDPIGSYGPENVEYLKKVSKKYDPGQTFQKLVPGGWKLGDAGKRKHEFNFNQAEKFFGTTQSTADVSES